MRLLRPTHIYHLSETASYQRVNALKLIESVPEAQEALFNGEVSLSNAALVQSFIQRSEKEAKTLISKEEKMTIIESIKGKTHREAQVTLAEENPIAALPTNKEKPLSKSHTQLQIVVDEAALALLKEIKSLLSHTIPDGDYNAVLNYIGKQVLEPLRKKKGQSVLASLLSSVVTAIESKPKLLSGFEPESEIKMDLQKAIHKKSEAKVKAEIELKKELELKLSRKTKANTDKSKRCVPFEILKQNEYKNRTRYIPQKVKRLVYTRSKGQCEFVGIDGHRCESRHQLEFDHIVPFSQRGTNDEGNIQILCRTHNSYRTKETHGFLVLKGRIKA